MRADNWARPPPLALMSDLTLRGLLAARERLPLAPVRRPSQGERLLREIRGERYHARTVGLAPATGYTVAAPGQSRDDWRADREQAATALIDSLAIERGPDGEPTRLAVSGTAAAAWRTLLPSIPLATATDLASARAEVAAADMADARALALAAPAAPHSAERDAQLAELAALAERALGAERSRAALASGEASARASHRAGLADALEERYGTGRPAIELPLRAPYGAGGSPLALRALGAAAPSWRPHERPVVLAGGRGLAPVLGVEGRPAGVEPSALLTDDARQRRNRARDAKRAARKARHAKGRAR